MEATAEDKAIDAFMADTPIGDQPANPEGEATGVEATEAPKEPQETQTEEKAEQQNEEVQTIEIDPDEPLFEQEIDEDGTKVAQKLSLKELQQGYLRERDYRKKTMDLARQRDELPKLVAKQAQDLSESYGKRLAELQGLVMKTVAADVFDQDLNKLAAEDPFEYVRISNRRQQINELLQTVQKEVSTEAQKREEEYQKASAYRWQQSMDILNKEIPDFGPAVVKRLIDAGTERGFSKEEVGAWTDHRLIKMLHELSDKKVAETKRPEVEKKVAVVTKTVKPGQAPKKTSLDEARAHLKKTGKPNDALPFFEAMLR